MLQRMSSAGPQCLMNTSTTPVACHAHARASLDVVSNRQPWKGRALWRMPSKLLACCSHQKHRHRSLGASASMHPPSETINAATSIPPLQSRAGLPPYAHCCLASMIDACLSAKHRILQGWSTICRHLRTMVIAEGFEGSAQVQRICELDHTRSCYAWEIPLCRAQQMQVASLVARALYTYCPHGCPLVHACDVWACLSCMMLYTPARKDPLLQDT